MEYRYEFSIRLVSSEIENYLEILDISKGDFQVALDTAIWDLHGRLNDNILSEIQSSSGALSDAFWERVESLVSARLEPPLEYNIDDSRDIPF